MPGMPRATDSSARRSPKAPPYWRRPSTPTGVGFYPAPGSDGDALVTEGILEGRIALEPAGGNGFGYDPVFFVPEAGKTAAMMDRAEKNSISHRYRALVEMKALLDRDAESLE